MEASVGLSAGGEKIFLLTHDLCVISYAKFVFIRRIEK